MTARIPEHVRHEDVDADRLMIASWFFLHGDRDIALHIARSVVPPYRQDAIERQLPEIAEILERYEYCERDPQDFAMFSEGRLSPPPNWSWDEWGAEHCGQLAADARVRAWQLAQLTDRERVSV